MTTALDHPGGFFLKKYISGRLIEFGMWGTARLAMGACAEGGTWIEYEPRKWRSQDGRWLIGEDFTEAERGPIIPKGDGRG